MSTSGTRRRGPLRFARTVLVTSALVLAGCGEDEAGVSHDEMADTLADRIGLDPVQADCVADRLAETLDADDQRTVVDDGVAALAVERWPIYVYGLIGCLDPNTPHP